MTNDDLVICAFRYCLGRKSYVVGEMCNHLRDSWDTLGDKAQSLIRREISEALRTKTYGMAMDGDAWRCLLDRVTRKEGDNGD